MTEKQFYDWQTLGGTDDVMRFVNALESADILWCAIGGVAVNHWASEQMVTQDVDFVVAADSVEGAEKALVHAGFRSERFEWSINFKGSIQLTTEDFYRDFAERGVAADVHGILLRVATLEDTLDGKIRAGVIPLPGKANGSRISPTLPGLSNRIRISGICSMTNFSRRSTDRTNGSDQKFTRLAFCPYN